MTPLPTRNSRQLTRPRWLLGALFVGVPVAACSSVPDVTYSDGEPTPTLDASLDDGAVVIVEPDASSSSSSSSSGDASASGGASSSGGPTCVALVSGVPLQCCGDMQCVGDGCGECGNECGSKCKDPKKNYCCKNRGESLCLKADKDCYSETD